MQIAFHKINQGNCVFQALLFVVDGKLEFLEIDNGEISIYIYVKRNWQFDF